MRKRGSLTKGLCLAVITFAMNATIITATENDNTTVDNATVIGVNSAYSDNLLDSSDVNWYEFSLSDDGVISLEFEHDYLESNGRYWRVTLYDSGQKELASYAFSGNTTSYKQGQIGVPAGSYYVKLTDDDYYSDVNYNVKINFTESKEWETEFNEEYTAADEITVNSAYYGSMRTSSDTDWYIFKLNEDGYISLSFAHDYLESSGRYWRATLYDSGQKELVSYTFSGDTTSYEQEPLNVETGKYYVKFTNDSYYSDLNYKFKINYDTKSNEPLENPFVDVNEDKYYYDAVIWAVNNGITNGKDATHFKPDEKCTRAQVVTFLWRTMGEPEPMLIENPFEDVAEEDYYYKAVLWAYKNNITQGIDDTHFAPGKTVTRAQFVTFLYRNEDEPEYTVSNPFVDVKQNKYYYDAVLWAYENDIVLGKDETHFGPEDYATRGQVVTFLYRAYGE